MTDASIPAPSLPIKPPVKPLGDRLFDTAIWGAVIILLIYSFKPVEGQKAALLVTHFSHIQAFLKDFLRPDFGQWKDYVGMMWLTVQMALWGTSLAIVFAVPLGLIAARNIVPVWVQWPVRRLLDLLRSVPDLVLGMIFLIAVGPGPFAGVLAIAVNTGGVLGKLFSESVEAVDRGPIEGVRATGAARLQEVTWGVLPQVAPHWTSYALYRFESSARSASILGIIGAGGIGQTLKESLDGFAFSQTGAIVVIVIVAVTLIDMLSQVIRGRLL